MIASLSVVAINSNKYMMADYVDWQKSAKRQQERVIADLKEWLDHNGQHHQDYTKKRKEYIDVKLHLKQFLQATFKEVSPGQCQPKYVGLDDLVSKEINCVHIGEHKLCSYKCCLDQCNECRPFPRNRGEHYTTIPKQTKHSYHMITWCFHEARHTCKIHGSFVNNDKKKAGLCPICETLQPHERPQEKPKKTEDPVKKTAPIHDFVTHFENFINSKWRLHNCQKQCLNTICKRFRCEKTILKMKGHNKDVFVVKDYTDCVKCCYDRSTQSGEMGGAQKNIGMEGFLYALLHAETNQVEHHWYGFLSDEK